MGKQLVDRLAIVGHGAIQVDDADNNALLVVLAGPIKFWWQPGQWDTEQHREYVRWRDAVDAALVQTGVCITYCPWRALRGAWTERAQAINDAAIRAADLVVVMTPDGIPADGTEVETDLANWFGVTVWHAPPGDDEALRSLQRRVKALRLPQLRT